MRRLFLLIFSSPFFLALMMAGTRLQIRSRSEAIKAGIDEIQRECQENSGGDWKSWFEQLAPFRADLTKKVQAAKPFNPSAKDSAISRGTVIEASGDPPLFETWPDQDFYLYSPTDLDTWVKDGTMVPCIIAVSQWLKQKNIDLIFIPVPKLAEVYADRISDLVPKDRIAAPQMRKYIFDLMTADVEVIDLLPVYLMERTEHSEPLYQAADPHWSQRGAMVAATEISARLARYEVVRRALSEPPAYELKAKEEYLPGVGYEGLNPDQKARVQKALTVRQITIVPRGKPLTSADSPIVLIGDSYNYALYPLIANEINMPLTLMIGGGQTVEAIKDFVRDNSLLANRKVVIWVISDLAVTKTWAWKLPPLR